ncbi:MAG: Hsp70 family protein, partial [Candidatus Peregrinibacteria bacterium]|nr:Hsp70 family protein [Candidatus Peregrinibacteria bacterium]
EKAKIELSSTHETEINLPFITANASGPKHLNIKMSRSKLEDLVADIIHRTVEPCRKAMEDAKTYASDIDEVLLVGGMTRMPAVQAKVEEIFGKEPHRGINPDEVVALGAGIQGGVLQGDVKDVLLLDVTPLTLGIETLGGVATPLIERNTTIPTSKSQVFSTAANNQTSVEIHVTQGERSMASDNKSLGKFILDGIPPAPRGVPQIEVTFDIDANGILNVKATDKATNKTQNIAITGSSGMSDEEIEQMRKEAEIHAEEDKKKKDSVEVRNEAETLAGQAERTLKEAGEKVGDDIRRPVEEKIQAVKDILAKEGATVDEIKAASEALGEEIQKIGSAMYQDMGQSEPDDGVNVKDMNEDGGEDGAPDTNAEDDVVDAEVIEEDGGNDPADPTDEEEQKG